MENILYSLAKGGGSIFLSQGASNGVFQEYSVGCYF